MDDSLLRQQLATIRGVIPLGSTWRHPRGQKYFVVGHCLIPGHLDPAVLCRGADSQVWCWTMEQFLGSRMVPVESAAAVTRK